jgi:hypothetical protein
MILIAILWHIVHKSRRNLNFRRRGGNLVATSIFVEEEDCTEKALW